MEELSEEKKKKIIWLRELLREKAPIVYKKFVEMKRVKISNNSAIK